MAGSWPRAGIRKYVKPGELCSPGQAGRPTPRGRRAFLKALAAGGVRWFWPGGQAAAQTSCPTLDAVSIPKYVTPLLVPPAMPMTRDPTAKDRGAVDYYEIAVRQFRQQILPGGAAGYPMTTVWGYGSIHHPKTFHYPAFTMEARSGRPVRVKWINDLKNAKGEYLPHLLPVDQTVHWANPPGGASGRDSRTDRQGSYRGPVPMVTHLHGGHASQESDGYAEAWYLPAATNLPRGFAREGSRYEFFHALFRDRTGIAWEPGAVTFQYENDQHPSTLWFHDHSLGVTRLNVYAGPAGFYLLRGGPGDLPAGILPSPGASSSRAYEIPIVVQDRSFHADGSLFYPGTRACFDHFDGPYRPQSDVPPIWNPEFFGNTMVVNGSTWPVLKVEQRRYRFRWLNGCNSRFLILKIASDPLAKRPAAAAMPFWQIGSEGGFLPAPVQLTQLLMAPAERADTIVDFTRVPVATELYVINEGPDGPLQDAAGVEAHPADRRTTGQVMKLKVVPRTGTDRSTDPAQLTLPGFRPIGPESHTRSVSLNEVMSTVPGFGGSVGMYLGTLDGAGRPVPLKWDQAVTENPARDAIEVWQIYNFTSDAHPIHIHEIQFQVVNREAFRRRGGTPGSVRPPEAWESGLKDTVIAYPGEITRVRALFDLAGLYVWHCHMLEHEDHEMMRPFFIGANPPLPTSSTAPPR